MGEHGEWSEVLAREARGKMTQLDRLELLVEEDATPYDLAVVYQWLPDLIRVARRMEEVLDFLLAGAPDMALTGVRQIVRTSPLFAEVES